MEIEVESEWLELRRPHLVQYMTESTTSYFSVSNTHKKREQSAEEVMKRLLRLDAAEMGRGGGYITVLPPQSPLSSATTGDISRNNL